MNFFVRDYQEDDFPGLIKLWEATGMGNVQRGDDEDVIEETLSYGGKLLILESDEGDIIGSSWLTTDQRRLYMHHFCILPEFQGKGLSHMLMEKSMEFVLETGLQVKIEVHRDNKVAKSLYRKYNFRYLGDYEVHIIRNLNDIKLSD
jgi:[ribosomal protein S18]-alanine N-acetyltransferase